MIRVLSIATTIVLLTAAAALPFGGEGCGAGECADCHSLSKEQANDALSSLGQGIQVQNVQLSIVPGLWSVVVSRPDGLNIPIFLDFSLTYIIQGEALEIATRRNITREKMVDINRVDYSAIPLDDAIVRGNPDAKYKLIVFDDPECPYCQKMDVSMKEVVAKRDDVAFYIKMMPLEIHPTAYDKAKAIICEKSLELLEKSLAGEEIPPPTCETDAIEKNRELAKKLRIRSTPSMVFPDGRAFPGFKSVDQIIELLEKDETYEAKK